MRHVAPWPDFSGGPVMEGDRVVVPSGDFGTVVYLPTEECEAQRWRIDFGHGPLQCLQAGLSETGRAVVIDESGMTF